MKYWIGVISKDHVEMGIAEGIGQLTRGKKEPLLRLSKDDWLMYYSSKLTLQGGEPYQKFTAIAHVADDTIYQVKLSKDKEPYRRRMNYFPCQEVPIHDVLEELSFLPDKKHWGYPFRFGLVQIPEEDFIVISTAMKMEK